MRRHARVAILAVLGLALLLGMGINLARPAQTAAATSNTVNFQARLQTISGAIVPDGNYNVEFKLYNASSSSGSSQGSCTGDANCLWTETRQNFSAHGVQVIDGYLSVNLGSVTGFPAINWDQQLWLTMNIGGTSVGASPTYDGEMSPRLPLTALPYAFRAGQLALQTGANESTLGFAAQTAARSLLLPDEGGTLCVQSSANCGFATGSGTAFIQGGNSFGAAGNLGTNDGNALNLRTNNATRLTVSTTGDLTFAGANTITSLANANLTLQANGTGTTTLDTSGTGIVTVAANATTLNLASTGGATAINIGNTTGATGITARVGTGNFSLDGVTNSTYTLGASTTTGTISIGGTAETGTLTVGSSSGTNILNLGAGAGATTVNVGNANAAGAVNIGNALTTGTINISTGVNTGTLSIGTGTGVQTINLATGGTGAKTVTLGSLASTGTTTVQGGTGGVKIGTGGIANTVQIGNTTGAVAQIINIGNNATAASTNTVNIGSKIGTSPVNIAAGTTGVTVQGANTTTAFQILQNSTGASLLNADTTNQILSVGSIASSPLSLSVPGISGAYASTPDSAANSVTSDIDIVANIAPRNWTPTTGNFIVAKRASTSTQYSYIFYIAAGGKLTLNVSSSGTAATAATASLWPNFVNGSAHWVRAYWVASSGQTQFFTSPDGVTWTQLGTNQTAAVGSIFDGTAPLEVGAGDTGGISGLFSGNIYSAQVWSGNSTSGGTLENDFETSDAAGIGSTSWTSSASTAGETWTVNGTASVVGAAGTIFTPTLVNVGTAGLFQNASDSTTAFSIQNAAGSSNLLIADTANSKIGIGAAPAAGGSTLQVTGSLSSSGLITGSAGLTVTGAAVNLNVTSNFATNINTGSSSGTITLGGGSAPLAINSTNFDVSTAGALSGITSYNQASGNATFNQNATDQLKVLASQVPTSDMVDITNTGKPVTTAGINGLQIDYFGGAAAVESAAARFNITPGGTAAGTWDALRIVSAAATTGVTTNGIKLESTAGTGTQNGLYFGTGWDNLLNYNGTPLINGTGILQSAAVSGTYGNLTGTGALAAGSIASGFGTISTANTITGTTLNGTTGINTGAATGTQRIDSSGNLVAIGNLTGSSAVAIAAGGAAQNLTLDGSTSGQVQIGGVSTGSILFAGGAGSTGCTITTAGALTCDGNITGAATGTVGYWSRGGTTLQPATAGDAITTTGNISTTSSGTITSAGLLTGSLGLTVTGAVASLNNSSNFATNINAGTSTGAVAIGNNGTAGNTLTLDAGTAANAIQIGNSATAHGIQIGTGAAVQTVVLGSSNGASATTVQGGTGATAIALTTGASAGAAGGIQIGNTTGANTQTINIGNNATGSSSTTVAIGSSIGASPTTVKSGTSGIALNPAGGSTNVGVLVKPGSDTTLAFQIQNASGQSLFQADTSGMNITLNGADLGTLSPSNFTTNGSSGFAARRNHSSVISGGYVYVFGGDDGTTAKSTAYYAPLKNDGSVGTWNTTTALPSARDYSTAVAASGYVYVIGGSTTTADAQATNTILYAKQNSDGTLGAWTTETPSVGTFPKVDIAASTAYNGYIYVAGGESSAGATQTAVYYLQLDADGSVGAINTTTALVNARTALTIAQANGYLYQLGGFNAIAQNDARYAPINANGTIGAWTTSAAMPASIDWHTTVVVNGYIYAIGGTTGGTSAQTAIYDAPLNNDGSFGTWVTNGAALPLARYQASSVTANGYIYEIGGFDGTTTQSTVYYASTSRIKVAGSLDLVGLNNADLNAGGTGGSLTAGNITSAGNLDVRGQGTFGGSLQAAGNLTVGGYALFQNTIDSTTAVQIENAAGTSNLFVADTTNSQISVGGNLAVTGTYNTNTFNGNTLTFGTAGTATIDSASGQTLQIGTGANAHNLTIGNTTSTSAVTIQGGTGNSVQLQSQGTILIANNAANQTVTVGASGSAANTTTVNLGTSTGAAQTVNAGSTNSGSNVNFTAGNTTMKLTNTSDVIQSNTANSTTAFQIQNAASLATLNYDTTIGLLSTKTFGGSYVGGADVTGATNTGTGSVQINAEAVQGHYEYTVKNGNATACSQTVSSIGCELQVYDVSNPAKPTYIGGADVSGTSNGGTGNLAMFSISIAGHYAYVGTNGSAGTCSQTAGSAIGCEIQVYDVSNPAKPTYVGGADISGTTNGGTGNNFVNADVVSGSYLYVATDGKATTCSQTAGSAIGCEIQVYDVSNPATPTYIGGADVTGSTNSGTGNLTINTIAISGRYLYAGTVGNVTTCSGTAGSAIGCEIQVYDLNNPAAPAYIAGTDSDGTLNGDTNAAQVNSIYASGNYIYVDKQGINSSACSQTPGPAEGCELMDFNVSNPAKPTYVGGADSSGATNTGSTADDFLSVYVAGHYAYVGKLANATACSQTVSAIGCELQVYDVSNPAVPAYIGGDDVSGTTNGGTGSQEMNSVFVAGNYVYTGTDGNVATCSATVGSAIGCDIQSYNIGGIDANAIAGGSLEGGSLQVDNNASVFNQLSVGGSASIGLSLDVQGNVGVGGQLNVGSNTSLSTTTLTIGGNAVCTSAGCTAGGGLAKNAVDTSTAAVTAIQGSLYTFTNSSSAIASGVLSLVNGTNTHSTLSVTASGNPTSGQALIFASDTNATPSGNLIDLQAGSSPVSVFNVSAAGAVTSENTANSIDAFQVQTSTATPLFQVDTLNNSVKVGPGAFDPTGGDALTVSAPIGAGATFPDNIASYDSSAAAQGVGGGIEFAGAADQFNRTFAVIQGYHESATTANYAGALRFLTRPSGGNPTQVLNLASNGAATFQNSADSTSALQVQNALGVQVLTADTTNSRLTVNTGYLWVQGLANPTSTTASNSTSSGTLAAGTYEYRVSATGPAGESVASATTPATLTLSGATNHNTINWTTSTGATGYNLYRRASGFNANAWYKLAVGNVATYNDTSNAAWVTTGGPSTTNYSGRVSLNEGAPVVFDTNTNGNNLIRYLPLSNALQIANYNASGAVQVQADSFQFQDTTGFSSDFSITNTGATLFQNRANSITAFQIQNTLGTSNLFVADSTNTKIGIGLAPSPGGDTLQVGTGGLSVSDTTFAARIDGSVGLQVETTGSAAFTNLGTNVSTTPIINFYNAASVVVASISGTGQTLLQNSANSTTAFQVQNATGADIFTVDTTNAKVGTADQSAGSTNSSNLVLQSGNAGGATSNSGSVTLDSGTATGTAGNISIGTGAYDHNVTIGNITGASAVTIQGGTGAIGIGTQAVVDTITIGNSTGASSVVINDGTGALSIGTNAIAHTITLGNVTGATSVVVNCGTGACSFGTSAIAHTTTVGTVTGAGATTIQAGTGALNITAATTGTIKIGGAAQSGAITLGSSTAAETVNIGTGVAGANNQTVNIGTTVSGGAGIIAVNIGSTSTTTNGLNAVTILAGNHSGSTVANGSRAGTDTDSTGIKVSLGDMTNTNAVCANLASATAPTSGTGYELVDCSGTPIADYAEQYPVATDVGVGDVVATGTQMVNTYDTTSGSVDWTKVKGQITQLVKSDQTYQSNAIGIVSDNTGDFSSTGYNIKPEDNPMSVALNGRVPVNVTTENGPIEPGDYLTTSATHPGYAMKATQAGYVIGQALSAYTSPDPGQVMAFVKNTYYPGPNMASMIQDGGDANLSNLTVSGNTALANLDVAGDTTLASLNVSGPTTLASLTVIGDINAQGNLTVTGNTSITGSLNVTGPTNVADIIVSGHVITAGGQPTAQIQAAAGTGVGAVVTVAGTDTTGTITITTGSNPTAGAMADILFSKAYGAAPHIVLSPSDDKAAALRYFKGATTTNDFMFNALDTPAANTSYQYDYFIAQ